MLRARNALRERDTEPEDWAAADARNCPDWVQVWAAHLRTQGEPDTSGISRWGRFGSFKSIADEMKESRNNDSSVKGGIGVQDNEIPEKYYATDTDNLESSQKEFVQEYLEADIPTDRETIVGNIRDNDSEFNNEPDVDCIVESIQAQIIAQALSADEIDFVCQYLDEGLPVDDETIELNVKQNRTEFDGSVNMERICKSIHQLSKSTDNQ
jgi:hypothetical protein